MTASGRLPRPAYWLGALLLLYLAYPLGAFAVRVATGHGQGWQVPGLWSALRVSVVGSTISVLIGIIGGIPLAYVLAHRRGWWATVADVIVQLPLALPPLVSGILLIYIVGPYTFLGQLSGERLTQTMYGVVIAQSFVSVPFLVVVARSAFRAVDPALGEVAATLGHRPVSRFLRVDVPAAGEGLRTGVILMWLRAFGEYGTTVVLAYHPYSIPVYVDNIFSSAPLSQAAAPTILAFGVAAAAVLVGRARLPRTRRRPVSSPAPPVASSPVPVGFRLEVAVGRFELEVAHQAGSHRLAIVGPSGSGKSLTLRALAGLLGPQAGAVTLGGTDISGVRSDRRGVGYAPQGFGLIPGRTVWQQAVFGAAADPQRAAWWLRTLHLENLLDRYPEQLSGGERQRVSLVRALACDPRVVLLDEPFSALDAPVRGELRRELRRLQREVGLSTVLVTHDPQEAAMLADEIMVIDTGRVLQAGGCAEVFRRPVSVAVGRLLGIENLVEGVAGEGGHLLIPGGRPWAPTGFSPGTALLWQVPPEALLLAPVPGDAAAPGLLELGGGLVSDLIELGRTIEVTVRLDAGPQLRVRTIADPGVVPGSRCVLRTEPDAVSLWEIQTAGSSPEDPESGSGRPIGLPAPVSPGSW